MKLIQNNEIFSLNSVTGIHGKLPIGTYSLKRNEMTGQYFLKNIDNITMPTKIYGDVASFGDRIITKYHSIDRNLGILCVGIKGSGKTLEARYVASKIGLPVIIISEPFTDSNFIDFITDPVLGDCVIMVDEFEKVYNSNKENTESLLSLLDGPYNTHHIFIFTANSMYGVNEAMKNRPSRIHFLKEFVGLSEETVREIGHDLLNNKDYVESLVEISGKMSECTYDTIISICKDSNLYNEDPKACVKYMNVLLESCNFNIYEILPNGIEKYIAKARLHENGRFEDYWYIESHTAKDDDGDPENIRFVPDEYPFVPDGKDRYYSIPEHNIKLVFRRVNSSFINYVF